MFSRCSLQRFQPQCSYKFAHECKYYANEQISAQIIISNQNIIARKKFR